MNSFFEEIINPIEKKNFLENFYSKKHIYIKGNSNKFDNLFNIDRFNELLSNSYIEKFLLSLKNKIIHVDQIGRKNIRDYLLQGYTIKLNNIEYFNKEIAKSINLLKKEFLCDVKVNLYSSAPSKRAFSAHLDNYNVFILHLHGKKEWTIADISENDTGIVKNKFLRNRDKWNKWQAEKKHSDADNFFNKNKNMFKSYILEKGDVLYIPKGFVHKVQPIEETLHLTIGFSTINGLDFFLAFSSLISNILENINIPILNKNYSISSKKYITQVSNVIKETLKSSDSKALLDLSYKKWLMDTPNSNILQLPYNYLPFENNFENIKLKLNSELFSISNYNNKIEVFISYQSIVLNNYFNEIIKYISNKDSFTLREVLDKFKNINSKSLIELFYYLIKNSIIIYDK